MRLAALTTESRCGQPPLAMRSRSHAAFQGRRCTLRKRHALADRKGSRPLGCTDHCASMAMETSSIQNTHWAQNPISTLHTMDPPHGPTRHSHGARYINHKQSRRGLSYHVTPPSALTHLHQYIDCNTSHPIGYTQTAAMQTACSCANMGSTHASDLLRCWPRSIGTFPATKHVRLPAPLRQC